MRFRELTLRGAWLIEPERREDERGFFARTWCSLEFAEHGLAAQFVQCSISYNARRGTLRGLHYQAPPHAEAKLVRCTAGAVYDVIVDLREDSPFFKQWVSVVLSAEDRLAIYVPQGFAHGFQTLSDGTEVLYQMSEFYHPESARTVRWDDPALAIDWPVFDAIVSPSDRAAPLLDARRR